MASNKKNKRLKSFIEKNVKSLRSGLSQLFYRLFILGISENSSKNVTAPETCGVTKYRLHDAFLHFPKISKKLLLKTIKNWSLLFDSRK